MKGQDGAAVLQTAHAGQKPCMNCFSGCFTGENMRLDKFLKVSRLIRRRTIANEACDAGRVLLNDRPAKASATVKAGDVIESQFGTSSMKVKVLDVRETVKKEEAENLYSII